nr:MAG: hypothetical protein DIU78_14350 [Pseudomonadota bacterium]
MLETASNSGGTAVGGPGALPASRPTDRATARRGSRRALRAARRGPLFSSRRERREPTSRQSRQNADRSNRSAFYKPIGILGGAVSAVGTVCRSRIVRMMVEAVRLLIISSFDIESRKRVTLRAALRSARFFGATARHFGLCEHHE